jgi:O-antigen ligase
MPDEWKARTGSIQTYEEDSSTLGRIYVWKLATSIDLDNPITGEGFGIYNRSMHNKSHDPIPDDSTTYITTDAHSINFPVFGKQSFIGLFSFLALWYIVFRSGGRVI